MTTRSRCLLPAASFALAALAAVSAARPASAQARLEHSAPWLGQTLTLDVSGGPAFQTVELFYSPAASALSTPLGALKLDRRTLRRIATGTADSSGHAAFQIPVPLDAALAGREAHFQALVTDPAVPAGRQLTNANHLRWLGTRIYVHERSQFPDPVRGGLEIVDAVHGVVSARVEFGPIDTAFGRDEGKPVFSANFAAAAVMATATRLVFFDPFFGAVRAERAVAPASGILWTDAPRTRVYVLERGSTAPPVTAARLRVFDLASAAEQASLALPEPASGWWCASDDRTAAFVGAFDAASGAAILRRIRLSPLSVLDSVAVGTLLTREFDHMQFAAGQVFVTSLEPWGWGFQSSWTRVTLGPGGMTASVQSAIDTRYPRFAAVPAADRVLVSYLLPQVPSSGLFEEPLAAGGPGMPVSLPWFYLSCDDMVAEDAGVWIMDAEKNEPPGADDPGRLYHVDLSTHAWTQYPRTWSFVGPIDLELVRDALTDQIFLACRAVPPPISIAPALFVIDRRLGMEHTLVTLRSPVSLLAVPVP